MGHPSIPWDIQASHGTSKHPMNPVHGLSICARVDPLLVLGMGNLQPSIGNPYNGYINPYYWVDDHPLLHGNNGSLDPGTYSHRIPSGEFQEFVALLEASPDPAKAFRAFRWDKFWRIFYIMA